MNNIPKYAITFAEFSLSEEFLLFWEFQKAGTGISLSTNASERQHSEWLRRLAFTSNFARFEFHSLNVYRSLSALGKQTSNPPSSPLETFPASFTTDFLGKPAENIANDNHAITGDLATSCKYKSVVKHLKCGHVTRGQCEYLWQLGVL